MNLLEVHAKALKINTSLHGRLVVLEDPQGTTYPGIYGIFNYVEHGLKLENIENPIGAKSNIYIDRDSLQLETGEIKPKTGWTVTGSANLYDDPETFYVELDKSDLQIPGIILFLTKEKPGSTFGSKN